jgi:hypothetical protein
MLFETKDPAFIHASILLPISSKTKPNHRENKSRQFKYEISDAAINLATNTEKETNNLP